MAWTLKYFPTTGPAVQKSLAAWGIVADIPFEFASQARSLVDIITVDDLDDAFQWEYDTKVHIYNGSTIWFQGYVAEPRRLASGPRENHRYTIYDWWWLAERCPFRRIRLSFTGDLNFVHLPPSEAVLFENELEQPVRTLEQMIEVFALLNECYNPTRRGATSGIDPLQDVIIVGAIETDLAVPRYPIRDIMCSEVMRQVLAWTQDAVLETDYSIIPPIVSVRRVANMPAEVVTLPADRATVLDLKPRYDLQIPGVIIYYKKIYTTDGTSGLRYWPDIYPTNLSKYHPTARVHTIDLVGGLLSTVPVQKITSETINANAADAATRREWWIDKNAWLAPEHLISNLTITDVKYYKPGKPRQELTPAQVAAVPNELTNGAIAPWMNEQVRWLIIEAKASYRKKASANVTNQEVEGRVLTARIQATSAGPGVRIPYTTISHFDPGEEVPIGLAQDLYESHQALQYEAAIELVGDEIPSHLALGKLLTINTPGGSYENLLIQRIGGELTQGRMAVHVGPPGHLGFTDMIELHRVNRYRFVFNLPSNASNPLGDPNAELEFPEDAPKENSTDGAGNSSYDAATSLLP